MSVPQFADRNRFMGFAWPQWLAMASLAVISYFIVDMADGSPEMPDCPACPAKGAMMHEPWCPFGYVPAKALVPLASVALLAAFTKLKEGHDRHNPS